MNPKEEALALANELGAEMETTNEKQRDKIINACGAYMAAKIDLDKLVGNAPWPVVLNLVEHEHVGRVVQKAARRVLKINKSKMKTTYEEQRNITIAGDHHEGEQFVAWLLNQGHDAELGRDDANYVDGENTRSNPDNQTWLTKQWDAYCADG